MFGNINAKLKLSVLGFCRNGLNYSKSGGEYSIKCISVRDFQNNLSTKQIEDVETISIDHPVDGPFLENGDILFVRSNGNKSLVGRSLLVEGLSELTSYSGFCISYRLYDDNILLPDFLIHYLHMDSSRQLLFKNARGCNISNLTQGMIYDLDVPIPSLSLQREYIDFVAQVDKSKFYFLR